MKTYTYFRVLTWVLILLFNTISGHAQVKYVAKNNINMVVAGTSTMHDWTMKSGMGDCTATFTTDATGNLKEITGMQLTVPSKALKSGKTKMDENAYDALKAEKNPSITAVLKQAELTSKDNRTYLLKGTMRLTIAGKTLDTDLQATLKKNADNTLNVRGDKKISMKEYGMEPPSFMMGTIKTGNDLTLSFDLNLSK